METAYTTSITGVAANTVARLVQLLKIEGFSTTVSMGSNDFIASRWNIGGYEWELRAYPANEKYYTSLKFTLGLVFLSESRTNGSIASLGWQLIDPTGEIEPSEENTVRSKSHHPQDCLDQVVIMPRDELVTSGYIEDDSLTLRCTITVLEELPVPTIAPPSSNLHKHFGELLQSGTGADVTFVVSGESFPAHKLILSARSPVFMAEFFGETKEKCSQLVEVKDMDAAVFKAMLHFIYTDTVPELDQPPEAVATMAQHLLVAADRYGLVDRLKLICEIKLSDGFTVETAASTLALAEQHNCLQLKAKCAEFIVSTPAVLDAVLATEGYKHLVASCPSLLTDLLKFACGRKN